MRLDRYLVENKYFKSRQKAKEAIKSGFVMSDGEILKKPAAEVYGQITISQEALKYVGRSGLKLEKAIEHYNLDFNDKVVLDVGASTGGFTDCALQHGASHVLAIDVGTNQIDEDIKNNPKVESREKCNILAVESNVEGHFDYCLVDVSFISLTKLLDHLHKFDVDNYIILVKPQFETGGLHLVKGIVRDNKVRQDVVNNIKDFAIETGFKFIGVTASPIKGSHGNKEYLMYLKKD